MVSKNQYNHDVLRAWYAGMLKENSFATDLCGSVKENDLVEILKSKRTLLNNQMLLLGIPVTNEDKKGE